jgi:GntR family transcriptional regulator
MRLRRLSSGSRADRDPAGAAGASSPRVTLDAKLPTPLYHQLYLVLRSKIREGVYTVGQVVPGEDQLGREFGVSRITAKRALDQLSAESMVVRERGRGTRVTSQPLSLPVKSSVEGLLENLLALGLKTKVSLLQFDYVTAPPDIVKALACPTGAQVQRAVRVRLLDGEPLSYLTTYVPESVGRRYAQKDLAARPLLELLERNGVVVSKAEQTVTATAADPESATALGIGIGFPLLKVIRVVYDQHSRAVEYLVGLYRPDRYQLQMTLSRVAKKNGRTWSPAG